MDEKPGAHQTGFSLWLDAFRWIAAIAVLVTHAGNRLLAKIQTLPEADRTILHYAYQFASGFAHQAVMVFFVISGYLVGGSVWQEFRRTGDVNMTRFMAKRLIRLWIVLLPVFVIGGLLDITGASTLAGVEKGIYEPHVLERLQPEVLVCNAGFQQNFACWQFGSNGALWSLAHELWYYLLWPVALLAFFSRRPWRVKVGLVALLAAMVAYLGLMQFNGPPVLPYMMIWILGVWASSARRAVVGNVAAAATIVIVALLAIRVFVRYEQFVGTTALLLDLGTGVLFANLLVSMRLAPRLRLPPGRHIHQRLAGFSFSLYCLHTPVLMAYVTALVTVTGIGSRMVPRGLVEWSIVAAGLGVCIATALLLSLVTENKTEQLRRWFFTRVGWVPPMTGRS